MKMKRVFAVIIAAVSMFSLNTFAVAAALDDATYCFDTAEKLSDWQLTEESSAVNLKISIDTLTAEDGAGSLAIYESFKEEPPSSSTGIYVDSKTFGLENFAGYSMEISYKFNPDFEGSAENLSIFSDGIVWVQTSIMPNDIKEFQKAKVTVPENAANTRFGITIPTLIPATGTIVYIDNVVIYDAEGTAIANVGDYKISEENEADKYKQTGTLTTVIYVILLVVIILLVVGGIAYMVLTLRKRFR